MVGFNRRFSPLVVALRTRLAKLPPPYLLNYRWNNQAWSSTWPFDPVQGGGKLVSSGCHMIDLVLFLMGTPPEAIQAATARLQRPHIATHDTASVILDFGRRGMATLQTAELGAADYPQERLEIFADGRVLCLDNLTTLRGYGLAEPEFTTGRQEKGFAEELAAFADYLRAGGPSPCGAGEGLAVARCVEACLAAAAAPHAVNLLPQEAASCPA